jgi:O-6-methylguanine DNA methyltransferase
LAYKKGGRSDRLAAMGEVLAISTLESPIGKLRIAVTPGGVVRIALPRSGGAGFPGWLRGALPNAERVDRLPALGVVQRELQEYFAGQRREFTVPLDLRGTPFQLSVWRALVEIPFGETRTYAEIARRVKRPKAFRAVGAANGANPVPILVPCHRVIESGGKLGGYGGGLETKQRLLAFEKTAPARGALL